MEFEVIVELKPEVLDAPGRAITESIRELGRRELQAVRVTKRFVLSLEGDDSSSLLHKAESLAREFLANPVSETFKVSPLK